MYRFISPAGTTASSIHAFEKETHCAENPRATSGESSVRSRAARREPISAARLGQIEIARMARLAVTPPVVGSVRR